MTTYLISILFFFLLHPRTTGIWMLARWRLLFPCVYIAVRFFASCVTRIDFWRIYIVICKLAKKVVPTFLRVCQSGTWKNVGVVRVEIVVYIYIWTRPQRDAGVDCESRVLQKSVSPKLIVIKVERTYGVCLIKECLRCTGETRVDASWSHSKQNYPINTRLTLF